MSGPGVTVSGGGSVAVDTPAMQAATRHLDALDAALAALAIRLHACLADPAWSPLVRPGVRRALEDAAERVRAVAADVRDAGAGLTVAALRYGAVERSLSALQDAGAAAVASSAGAALRVGLTLAPGVLLPLGVAVGGTVTAATAVTAGRELLTTGRLDPQVDPVVLATLRRALSSSDDLLRGFALTERPRDLLANDPGGRYGTERTAAVLADLLPVSRRPPALTATVLPGAVAGPGSLAGLGSRVPQAAAGGAQVRLDRFPLPDGRSRWIVYLCGTITFSPAAGTEPFDLRSDVTGVAGARSDSEAAVAAAMRAAGVRPDEPVLLVGHSQGALDAVRLAERGGFAVAAVVTLGGPTGQLVPPVPELSVEHDEDPVPVLGGAPAGGAPGLHRVLVSRSLYAGGPPPGPPLVPFGAGAAPHALTAYRRTLALADASPDPRIRGFERTVRPFLAARDGRIVLVRVERLSPPGR